MERPARIIGINCHFDLFHAFPSSFRLYLRFRSVNPHKQSAFSRLERGSVTSCFFPCDTVLYSIGISILYHSTLYLVSPDRSNQVRRTPQKQINTTSLFPVLLVSRTALLFLTSLIFQIDQSLAGPRLQKLGWWLKEVAVLSSKKNCPVVGIPKIVGAVATLSIEKKLN